MCFGEIGPQRDRLQILASGAFELLSDTTVVAGPFVPVGGSMIVALTDGDASVQVGPGSPKTYFAIFETTASASSASPNRMRVVHVTESTSTAEDASNDSPLSLEFEADTDGPYLLKLQWRFRSDEFSFVPGMRFTGVRI